MHLQRLTGLSAGLGASLEIGSALKSGKAPTCARTEAASTKLCFTLAVRLSHHCWPICGFLMFFRREGRGSMGDYSRLEPISARNCPDYVAVAAVMPIFPRLEALAC